MRVCSECDVPMMQGYVIEDGLAYYCSEKCLHKNMSAEDFAEMFDDGEGNSYWSEWEYMNCDRCGAEIEEGYMTEDAIYCDNICLMKSVPEFEHMAAAEFKVLSAL